MLEATRKVVCVYRRSTGARGGDKTHTNSQADRPTQAAGRPTDVPQTVKFATRTRQQPTDRQTQNNTTITVRRAHVPSNQVTRSGSGLRRAPRLAARPFTGVTVPTPPEGRMKHTSDSDEGWYDQETVT